MEETAAVVRSSQVAFVGGFGGGNGNDVAFVVLRRFRRRVGHYRRILLILLYMSHQVGFL